MKNIRKIVKNGYEKGHYAKTFKRERTRLNKFEQNVMVDFVNRLGNGSKILDLGCGIGLPYDKYLINNGFDVTGMDFSKKHILNARKNVPKAKFIEKDFTRIRFRPESFDAVVSFYAIFHVPRAEHRGLFNKINKLLKPHGLMLVVIGAGEAGYHEEKDWAGRTAYGMEYIQTYEGNRYYERCRI